MIDPKDQMVHVLQHWLTRQGITIFYKAGPKTYLKCKPVLDHSMGCAQHLSLQVCIGARLIKDNGALPSESAAAYEPFDLDIDHVS